MVVFPYYLSNHSVFAHPLFSTYERYQSALSSLETFFSNLPIASQVNRSTAGSRLVQVMFGQALAEFDDEPLSSTSSSSAFAHTHLNPSQVKAVQLALRAKDVCLIHGPPGTGMYAKRSVVLHFFVHHASSPRFLLRSSFVNIRRFIAAIPEHYYHINVQLF